MVDRAKADEFSALGALLADKGAALPLLRPEPLRAEMATPTATESRQRANVPAEILILSVDRLSAKLYRDLLEARGYGTAGTENVHRLVEVMRLCRPDLVILDLHLGHQPDVEVVREIKCDPPLSAIPLIGVAELFAAGDETAVLAAGCDDCIAKPIAIEDFYRSVERLLERSSTANDEAPRAAVAGLR